MKKVSAARGWQWVVMALRMVRQWPGVFGMAGLIAAAAFLFPIAGSLALLVFGPVYLAGLTIAARRVDRGETPTLADAFTLFREEGRLKPALALCLPIIAGELLAAFVAVSVLLTVAAQIGIDLSHVPSQAEVMQMYTRLAESPGGWMLLVFAIRLFVYAFVVLAIPDVGLHGRRAFPAMGASLRAVLRNPGPWIVAALGMALCVLVPAMFLIGVLRSLLLTWVFSVTAIYSLLGPLLYVAWRDISGEEAGASSTSQPPPPPSFEA